MKKFKKIKLTLLVAFMASQFVVPFYKKNVFATNSFKQNVVDEDSEIEVPVLRHVDGHKATDVVLQHQLIKEKEKSLIESAKQSEPELYDVLNEDKTVPKTYFVLGVGLKKSDDFSIKYQDVLDLFRGREDLNLSVRVVSTEGKVLARGKKKKSVLSDIEVLTFVIPADLVPNGKNTCKLEFYEGDVLIGTVENFGTVMEACRFGPKEVREAYASGKMSAEKVLNKSL